MRWTFLHSDRISRTEEVALRSGEWQTYFNDPSMKTTMDVISDWQRFKVAASGTLNWDHTPQASGAAEIQIQNAPALGLHLDFLSQELAPSRSLASCAKAHLTVTMKLPKYPRLWCWLRQQWDRDSVQSLKRRNHTNMGSHRLKVLWIRQIIPVPRHLMSVKAWVCVPVYSEEVWEAIL
jgi:hypothetical protein